VQFWEQFKRAHVASMLPYELGTNQQNAELSRLVSAQSSS